MGVILALMLVLAILLVGLVFTRGKPLNLRFTPPVMKSGPIPMSEAGSPDEIAKRIEADAERMGIDVSDEDVKRLADQIRAAEEQAKSTGSAETTFTLGEDHPGMIVARRDVATPPIVPVPETAPSTHVIVVSAPNTPPSTGAAVPVTFDVEEPGGAKSRITAQMQIPPDRWAWMAAGMRLPARIDPEDPSKIEIDWDRI